MTKLERIELEIADLRETLEKFKNDLIGRETTEGDEVSIKAYQRNLEKLIEERDRIQSK